MTNNGSSRATQFSESDDCHLFNRSASGSSPAGLWLYREQNTPSDRAADRWTRDREPSNTRTYEMYGCGERTLDSGASITTTYEVWDDYATEQYYPTGTYRFEQTIPLWNPENEDSGAYNVGTKVEWWIDLKVAKNDDTTDS